MNFLMNAYHRWQVYMYENTDISQKCRGICVKRVNHRVANFDLKRISGYNGIMQRLHLLALTAPEAYVNTN